MTVKSFLSVSSRKYFDKNTRFSDPRSDNLWEVCYNRDGKMRGQFWRGCLGGGYITGETTSEDICGENITYIFPNLQGREISFTCFNCLSGWTDIIIDAVLGRFVNGKLESGLIVKLVKGIIQQYYPVAYFDILSKRECCSNIPQLEVLLTCF